MIGKRTLQVVSVYGVLTVLGFAFWLLVVAPFLHWRGETSARADAVQAQLALLETAFSRLAKEHASLRQDRVPIPSWNVSERGVGLAEIQSRLTELARAQNIVFQSISSAGDTERAGQSVAQFRLEFEADLESALSFLREVENTRPAILVEEFTMLRMSLTAGSEALFPQVRVRVVLGAPIVDESAGDI